MPNFNYDPYSVEETSLQEREKRLLLDMLRQPKRGQLGAMGMIIGGQGMGDSFVDTVERSRAKAEYDQLPMRRQELSKRWQDDLEKVLGDPTPQNLARHPATRQQGLGLIQKKAEQEMHDSALKNTLSALGMGGGDGQTQAQGGQPGVDQQYQMALSMAMSTDPVVAKRGEMLLGQLKPIDPKNSFRPGLGGVPGAVLPGATQAYAGNQAADEEARAGLDMIDVPMGDGRTRKMSRLDYARMQGYGRPQSPQSAGPGPVGVGPSPAPGAGVGAPPQGAAPGPNAGPGPGAAPAGMTSDDPLGMIAAFRTAVQSGDMRAASYWGTELQKKGIRVDVSMPMGEQQRRSMAATGDPKQVPMQTPQAPPGTPTQLHVQPASQMGVADPEGAKFRNQQMETGAAMFKMFKEKQPANMQSIMSLDELAKMNASGDVITGLFPETQLAARRGIGFITGKQDPKVPVTEAFIKETLTQLKDQLKAFGSGTGISNLDLLTAERLLPQLINTQEGRARIIGLLKRAAISNEYNMRSMEQYYNQNRSLSGWQPQAYDEQGRVVDPLKANPNEPGQPSAAPGARNAPAPEDNLGAASPLENAGISLRDSLKSLVNPTTVLSKAKGVWDQNVNQVLGAGQLAGLYSGEDWAKRKAEQEDRIAKDEGYRTGHAFGSVGNWTSLLGGGGILKSTLGAILSGVIAPKENPWDKVEEGIVSGTVNAATHGLSKLIPNTEVAPTRKWFDLTGTTKATPEAAAARKGFESVPLNSNQINPGDDLSFLPRILGTNDVAAGRQAEALTEALMRRTGSSSGRVTRQALDQRSAEIGKEFDKLFPSNIKAKVDSGSAAKFVAAMGEDPELMKLTSMNKDLATVFGALSSNANGAKLLPMDVMQRAYNALRDMPPNLNAQKAREFLEGSMRKALGKDGSAKWDVLKNQSGTLKDIERMFKEGTGQGEWAGVLMPSTLQYSNRHSLPGSALESASNFVNTFGIRDPKYLNDLHIGDLLNPGKLMAGIPGLREVGRTLNAADLPHALDASPETKFLIELLRTGTTRAPRELIEYGRQ